jgi:hypothetical protein
MRRGGGWRLDEEGSWTPDTGCGRREVGCWHILAGTVLGVCTRWDWVCA